MVQDNTVHHIRDVLVSPATFCLIVSEQLFNGQFGIIEGEAHEVIDAIHDSSLEQFTLLNQAWHAFDNADFHRLRRMIHDMLTPLSAIITNCDYGLHILETFTPTQQERLQLITHKMYHLRRQLFNLTDYARFQTDTWRPITPINPRLYLKIKPDEFRGDALLQMQIPDELPYIHGNATYLSRSLMNLVDNAMRHTQAGGIDVYTQVTESELHIIVRDTGIGLQMTETGILYKPFYPLDITTHHLGLGLHLVERFMKLQGGKLEITSHPNEGTSVTMMLPLAKD